MPPSRLRPHARRRFPLGPLAAAVAAAVVAGALALAWPPAPPARLDRAPGSTELRAGASSSPAGESAPPPAASGGPGTSAPEAPAAETGNGTGTATGTAPSPPVPGFDPSSRVGDYAEGFPTGLVSAPEGATVVASSARPGAPPLTDITLNLASDRAADEVLAQLEAQLAGQGFARADADVLSGLDAQTAFSRRTDGTDGVLVETLLVGVLDDGGRTLVTISGSVVVPEG